MLIYFIDTVENIFYKHFKIIKYYKDIETIRYKCVCSMSQDVCYTLPVEEDYSLEKGGILPREVSWFEKARFSTGQLKHLIT